MATNLIVGLTLLFSTGFFLTWLIRRDLREKIERPKHEFQQHLQSFDQHCQSKEKNDDKINETL